MKFITATRLSQLFNNDKVGQGVFPELIKKLIIASANTLEYIRFPSGDAIYNPGFDGRVTGINTNSRFVPNGNSFWELGTNINPLSKLKTDFIKRTPDHETTFVFCTPHLLDMKKANVLIEQQSTHNLWKKIIFIDAAVLEDWLEENIEIAFWLLKQFDMDFPENDIKTLEDEAYKIYNLTSPKMTNDFLICSNIENANLLINKLSKTNNERIITIKSSVSLEQGYYFTIGALQLCKDKSITSRVIIAKSQVALNHIKNSCKNKIILLNFNCTDDELILNDNIFINITLDDYKNASISMEQIRFRDYEKCLENMGIDKTLTGKITADLNRNILCFKRRYAVLDTIKTPIWAKNENKTEIVPIALVSKFDSSCEGDCEILSKLSGCTIEDYTDKLDKWLQVDDSPISKINNSYFVNSKEEVLSVLKLNMQSSKVNTLAMLLDDVLTSPNPKYKKDPSKWCFSDYNDEKARYTSSMIEGIISTFAILSKRDNGILANRLKNIIDKMKNDVVSLHSILEHFQLLSEVSSKVVLDYLENAIDRNDEVLKNVIEQQYGFLFSTSNINYIIWTLHNCLQRKESAIQALRIYLKLYYSNYTLPNSVNLENEVITVFEPITSGCIVAATPQEKYQVLVEMSKNKDVEKSLKIIRKIKGNKLNTIFLPASPRWKVVDKDEISINNADIYEINDLANEWLKENVADKLLLIKELIKDIPENSKKVNDENFDFIKDQISSLTNREKNELNYFVLKQIHEIRFFACGENDFWQYKNKFITSLESIYDLTLPIDLFDRYAYIFRYSKYQLPILNPTPYSTGHVNSDEDEKESLINNCIQELAEKYGDKIIPKIIDECEEGFQFGGYLKKYFSDYLSAIKYAIKVSKLHNIQDFFYDINAEETINLFEKLTRSEKEKIVNMLPFQEEIMNYLNGTDYESGYWTGRLPCFDGDTISFYDKAFPKLLKYDPIMLIDWFAYYEKEVNYDNQILFLKAVSDHIEKLTGHRYYHLKTIIKKLDDLYYTDELSQIEMLFLPCYISASEDIPLGIKRYYWNNPIAFVGMIDSSVKCLDKPNTLGCHIACSLIATFGERCWIPTQYLRTKTVEIKEWVNLILETKKDYDEKTGKFIDAAIIGILALQPFQKDDSIWPSEIIADILELIAGDKLEEQKMIASSFASVKINSRGGRFVGDGSDEQKTYEEYSVFMNHYKATHPTTSLALEYIANSYKNNADMDKQQAIIGWGH